MQKQSLMIKAALVAVIALLVSAASAQSTNRRFGKWKLKSDAAPPVSNVMTYAPAGTKGMKVTIDAVNKDGVKSQWYYTTMFDGKDEPVTGNPGSDTAAVRVFSDRINEIIYKKAGHVTQVLTNVLSPDGSVIGIIYMRLDPVGKTTLSFATYERMSE
jgi:hypothetical protein